MTGRAPGSDGPGRPGWTGGPARRPARFLPALLVGLLALALLGPGALGAAPAAAAPAGTTQVPCVGVLWGSCDTRATANGYQYRYRMGVLERVPVGAGGGAARGTDCGDQCPDDPAAVCELLTAVGPDPAMTPEARAAYDAQVAGCGNFLVDNDGVPLGDVQAALADYLRDRLLPKPSIVIAPSGRSFANLATILYTPVPEAFTFNVDEPVVATISAIPHYQWDFGDGATGPDAPGMPYDPAISPRDHPEAYVSHGYARPGDFQVTLTVTWDGTFTVPGVAQAFPLNAVVLAAAQGLVVDEASGVLVHND